MVLVVNVLSVCSESMMTDHVKHGKLNFWKILNSELMCDHWMKDDFMVLLGH